MHFVVSQLQLVKMTLLRCHFLKKLLTGLCLPCSVCCIKYLITQYKRMSHKPPNISISSFHTPEAHVYTNKIVTFILYSQLFKSRMF